MHIRTPLLVGALVLAVTACGDDDATSSATTDAPAAATIDATTPVETSAADTTAVTTAVTTADTTADATADTTADNTTADTAATDTAATDTTTSGTAGEGANPDSPFCVAAQAAEDADDDVDFATGTPETIREQILASMEAGREAQELAPPEIAPTVDRLVGLQEQLVEVLEAHDWDIIAASTSPEGQALFEDPELLEIGAELDEYLQANCGITQD